MIIARPRIAGENVSAGNSLDGVPILSGAILEVTAEKYAESVCHEWFTRNFQSVTLEQVCAIEFIWDIKPCKKYPLGVSHQEIRNGVNSGESASWVKIVNANPHRYALIIGAWATLSASAPQPTVSVS